MSNRQIIYAPAGSMAARNKHETFPAIIVKMHKLLAWHPSEKGIIHCHTQELSKLLRNAFRKESRLIFYDNGDTEAKDEALRKHCESAQPTVLVAQSMQEGLNLRDDLSRFQAILKIPFPYLGDEGGNVANCSDVQSTTATVASMSFTSSPAALSISAPTNLAESGFATASSASLTLTKECSGSVGNGESPGFR